MTRTGEGRDDRHSKPLAWRFTSFTPLTAPIDQVLIQIKDEGALTFLEKLKGDPNKCSRDKYCRFHRDYSHDTADCYDLKQEIVALIRQGKLQKFVSRERADPPPQEQAPRRDNEHPRPPLEDIRMIVGGTATIDSSKMMLDVFITYMMSDIFITRRHHHPHDDQHLYHPTSSSPA